jgi:hypothetical protein
MKRALIIAISHEIRGFPPPPFFISYFGAKERKKQGVASVQNKIKTDYYARERPNAP